MATPLVPAAPTAAKVKKLRVLPWERTGIFWLELAYLIALAALALLYFTDTIDVRSHLGAVPIAIPWFGALGGVLISLTGVFDHPYDWDPGQRLWHVSRPLLGATVGVIAVLMFKAGILAAGIQPTPSGKSTPAGLDNLFFYLLAFAVGYREQTFRELMKRLLDVILSPGTTTTTPKIEKLVPTKGAADQETSVTILGSGLTGIQNVTFGDRSLTFEPHGSGALTVTAPKAETPGVVTVAIKTATGASAVSHFEYT